MKFKIFILIVWIFILLINLVNNDINIFLILLCNLIIFFVYIQIKVKLSTLYYHILYISFLLAYIIKIIIFNLSPTSINIESLLFTSITTASIEHAFILLTIIHLLLLALYFVVVLFNKRNMKTIILPRYKRFSSSKIKNILFITLIYIVVSSLIMIQYGVAIMGQEMVSLPYKLSGILFYSRTIIIPFLFIFLLQLTIINKNYKNSILILLIAFFLIISEIYIRTSKGAFFYFSLEILFLLLILSKLEYVKFNKKIIIYGSLISSIFLLSWPLFDAYRIMKTAGYNLSDISILTSYIKTENIIEFILYGLNHIINRLMGSLQLIGLIEMDVQPYGYIDFLLSDWTSASYYTKEILHHPAEHHSSSPSYFGYLYFTGGYLSMLLGTIIFLLVIMLINNIIFKLDMIIRNSLLPFFYLEILSSISAGTIGSSFYRLTILFIFVIFFLVLMKLKLKGENV